MRLSRARFSGSDASCRMPWPVAYITDMFESEFPAHTGPQFIPGSVEVSDKPVDPVQRLRPDPIEQPSTVGIEVTEPVGLQPVGQNTKQQVAGEMRRRPPPE